MHFILTYLFSRVLLVNVPSYPFQDEKIEVLLRMQLIGGGQALTSVCLLGPHCSL